MVPPAGIMAASQSEHWGIAKEAFAVPLLRYDMEKK